MFEREYGDSGWITPKGTSADAQRFFEDLGYSPQVRFNALYGREPLFFDEQHGRQVDVFVGRFGPSIAELFSVVADRKMLARGGVLGVVEGRPGKELLGV